MTHVTPILFWAPAVLLVPIFLAAAYLFFSLKVAMNLLAKRAVTRAELDRRLMEVVADLETLRTQVAATEPRPVPHEWPPADRPRASLNLNRRGQILRLHGKGRSTAEIAADLEISQGEVELMLKVHDWSATSPL